MEMILALIVIALSIWHGNQVTNRLQQSLVLIEQMQHEVARNHAAAMQAARSAAAGGRATTPRPPSASRQPAAEKQAKVADRGAATDRAAATDRYVADGVPSKWWQLQQSDDWSGPDVAAANINMLDYSGNTQPPPLGVTLRNGFEVLVARDPNNAYAYRALRRPIREHERRTATGQTTTVRQHEATRTVRQPRPAPPAAPPKKGARN